MDLEKVVEKGIESTQIFGVDSSLSSFIFLGILLTLCVLYWLLENMDFKYSIGISIFFIILAIGYIVFFLFASNLTDERKLEWEHKYAYPYIQSLEKEKYEIVSLKIVSDGDSTVYTDKKEIETLYVDVLYKDNEGTLRRLNSEARVYYVLEKDEAPYLEYQDPKDTLKGLLDDGEYNLELYTNALEINKNKAK